MKTAKLRVTNTQRNSEITKKTKKMYCCIDYTMQYYTVYGIAQISITEYRTTLLADQHNEEA